MTGTQVNVVAIAAQLQALAAQMQTLSVHPEVSREENGSPTDVATTHDRVHHLETQMASVQDAVKNVQTTMVGMNESLCELRKDYNIRHAK